MEMELVGGGHEGDQNGTRTGSGGGLTEQTPVGRPLASGGVTSVAFRAVGRGGGAGAAAARRRVPQRVKLASSGQLCGVVGARGGEGVARVRVLGQDDGGLVAGA